MKRLLIIGPLAALAVAGCGSSSTKSASAPAKPSATASAVQQVPVNLADFKIAESKTHLHPGRITFDVKNTGKVPHEFLVIDTAKPAAKLGAGSRVPEKGNIGETGNVKPGASKKLVLNLGKGHYAVICNDPGHYMAGMHKDLIVS
jgi:uncharacterized cupredoxin-like copper-binding protein